MKMRFDENSLHSLLLRVLTLLPRTRRGLGQPLCQRRSSGVLLLCLLLTSLFLRAEDTPPLLSSTPASSLSAHALLEEAERLFRQANETMPRDPEKAKELYAQAALRFEYLIRELGIRNGKLEYNLGNAYFRMGDLGRAILHYRRAEILLPEDPYLHQNLAYARSLRRDKIEALPTQQVLKVLLFWHYDFSLATRTLLFLLVFFGFWLYAAIRRLFRFWNVASHASLSSSSLSANPRRAEGASWLLRILGVIALGLLGSLLVETLGEKKREGVILASEIVARKGNGEVYEPSFREPLHAGTEFRLLEARGEWFLIELLDHRTCWIPAPTAALIDEDLEA